MWRSVPDARNASRCSRPTPPGRLNLPNDHTVPQMYLRRFSERRGRGYFTIARSIAKFEHHFASNVANLAAWSDFYTVTNDEGEPSRDVDVLFGRIETAATPAFAAVLDQGQFAFPNPWQPSREVRTAIAYFLAAQLLRSTRQRLRLFAVADRLPLPPRLRDQQLANEHGQFVIDLLGDLAAIFYARPWGLVFSVECLFTTDVPVVLMNHHDDDNQLAAASFWEVILPLDPHRLLFLPSVGMVNDDPRKSMDHRGFLDGGFGSAINQAMVDAAHEWVFQHPGHPPAMMPHTIGRLPLPGTAEFGTPHDWYFDYDLMRHDQTILRSDMNRHPTRAAEY